MKYLFRIIWVLGIYLIIIPIVFIFLISFNLLSVIYYFDFNHLIKYSDLSHEYSTGIFLDDTDNDCDWQNNILINTGFDIPIKPKVYKYYFTAWDYIIGKITQSNSYPKNR